MCRGFAPDRKMGEEQAYLFASNELASHQPKNGAVDRIENWLTDHVATQVSGVDRAIGALDYLMKSQLSAAPVLAKYLLNELDKRRPEIEKLAAGKPLTP